MHLVFSLQLLSFVSACLFAFPDDKATKAQKKIVACRVTLGLVDSGKQVELLLTNAKLIEKLVLQPLHQSKADPRPARYEPIASVRLIFKDGSGDDFLIFKSWKHYKRNDEYMISDFEPLKKEFIDLLESSKTLLQE